MGDQLKNMMIGIFVLAALAIVVFIMLFLHPNLGNEGKTLSVRFSDIDKISVGTRVTFAGKPVGEVMKIEEINAGERVEQNGIIYIYDLILAIDSSVEVFETDEITSRTSGLLGEKSVAITPQPLKKGEQKILIGDQVLYANETGSVESTLKDFKALSNKIEVTLDGFIEAFDTFKKENFWGSISNVVRNLEDISVSVNQPGKLRDIIDNIDRTAKNFNEMAVNLNQPGKLTNIVDNFRNGSRDFAVGSKNWEDGSKSFNDVMTKFNAVITNVQQGEGSIGKILMKDDFYLRLSSLMSKAEVVLNDVNHYGVLFHLDKGWQRLRARRLNLLQKLSTPEEFRNYFNDEVDNITTSLERVSDVIEEVESISCEPLWQNPGYVKVYAELLRRVAMLEEYLQMYNQQVVECPVGSTEFLNSYNF
ncbi:MAG: MCE family protein [Parachlamydiaceae bacterium]|nr:MCE family protein [Parachlamydiaceae bacterium]